MCFGSFSCINQCPVGYISRKKATKYWSSMCVCTAASIIPLKMRCTLQCYDDACHLMKYATNTARRTLTPTAKRMAEMSYVVDRMHFKGYVDPWCRKIATQTSYQQWKWYICKYGCSRRSIVRFVNRHSPGSHATPK